MAYYDNGIVETVRVFLNAFGFALKNSHDGERKIYIKRDRRRRQDEQDAPVGKFHINFMHDSNNNVFSNSGYLYAKFGTGILTAQIRSKEHIERIYNRINIVTFEFSKDGKKINGEMVLKLSKECYYSCSVNMTCLSEKDGKTTTILLNNGDELFNANIKDSTSNEEIRMAFFGPGQQGVWHTKESLGYGNSTNEYPSSEKTEITGFEKLSSFVRIYKESTTREVGKITKKTSTDKKSKPATRNLNKKEALTKRMLCAANILCNEDLTISSCIYDLFNKTFVVGNNKVANNLAIICYAYYDDRAIDALLGISVGRPYYLSKHDSTDSNHKQGGSRKKRE